VNEEGSPVQSELPRRRRVKDLDEVLFEHSKVDLLLVMGDEGTPR
jgi:hypothetical protein